ncbi:hypothetical protein Vadar_004070 [Vaccinium darrowii]|uniref:Uncharacterized protein n=1 Tax=Vaccinium darrowii TaxID=229202 RepID=A0ACB7XWP4_9ERIC|nr:hypothetical protein Vadar_004070 [Vaccinium darrowii]
MCLFNQSSIVICNPAIREFRVLPQPPYEARRTSNLGFCFDPKSNDYKVVRVATLYESDLKPYDSYDDPYEAYDKYDETVVTPVDHKIQIYGMGTNSWKEIVDVVPKDFTVTNSGPCVSLDGVFYWLGFDYSTSVPLIHTFSMFEELFERIPFPDAFCFEFIAYLCILKNSLALVRPGFDGQCYDIWVKDEYRVKESWTKKYTVGNLLSHYSFLGFRPNVEVFLLSCGNGRMVSYNLSTGDINEYNQLYGRLELDKSPPNYNHLKREKSLLQTSNADFREQDPITTPENISTANSKKLQSAITKRKNCREYMGLPLRRPTSASLPKPLSKAGETLKSEPEGGPAILATTLHHSHRQRGEGL